MFLVLKRFPMDEVPMGLYETMDDALSSVESDEGTYATQEQQDIADCDIGCEFCNAYLIVEFDKTGKPTKSEVIT